MPRTARTPVKGNAHNCEMDDDNHDKGTKKKTSKERNDETNRVCTADSREICRTCRLRVVEAKEMGIECYVCNRWFDAKCEKKKKFNVFGKKNSSFRWMCETCRDQDIGTKIERLLKDSGRSKIGNYTNERTTARNSREKPNGKSR